MATVAMAYQTLVHCKCSHRCISKSCRYKEAAEIVLNKGLSNVKGACQKMKTSDANKRAVYGSRGTFQERQFTSEEERRVASLERSVEALMMRGIHYLLSGYIFLSYDPGQVWL